MKRFILACAALAATAAIATPALAGVDGRTRPRRRRPDRRPEPPVARLPDRHRPRHQRPEPEGHGGRDGAGHRQQARHQDREVLQRVELLEHLLAGAEAVRLRARGGHDHAGARQGRRVLGAVLQREPGRADPQGPHAAAEEHRRPAQPRPVRADRHDRRRLHQEQDPPDQDGALPLDDDDHVPAGAERSLRRLGLRRADPRRPEGARSRAPTARSSARSRRASSTASSSRRAASCCRRSTPS